MGEAAQDIKIVENLERSWPSRRKNVMVEDTVAGETRISFAWEHAPLKIVVWAIVGARGRMTEQVLAIDSSVTRSVLDKLLVWQRVTGDGFLLPLYEMRQQKRKEGTSPLELCRSNMRDLLERVAREPDRLVGILRNRALESGESVATVSGGLPSLGNASH
jgi:hypothetical protein